MIFLKYLLIFIVGWISSVIIGAIIGSIFRSNESKIGGLIAGLISPSIIVFLVSKILLDKNTQNTYDILPISIILIPYVLINIRALYNSGVQDGSGDNTFGTTGITMKVNKGLIFGGLLGSIIALIYFTQYTV